jgi:hypothetical protein
MPSPKLNFGMKGSVNHEGTRIHTNDCSLIRSLSAVLSDVAAVIIEIIHDELVGEVGSSAVFPACTIGSSRRSEGGFIRVDSRFKFRLVFSRPRFRLRE